MSDVYQAQYHIEVIKHDLPWFRQRLDSKQWNLFRQNLEAATREVLADPFSVGTDCRYELREWRRHKFFAGARLVGKKPMGRIIFVPDEHEGIVFISTVWFRPEKIEEDLRKAISSEVDTADHLARKRGRRWP